MKISLYLNGEKVVPEDLKNHTVRNGVVSRIVRESVRRAGRGG